MSGWTHSIAGAKKGDTYWCWRRGEHWMFRLVELAGDVLRWDHWAVVYESNGAVDSLRIRDFTWLRCDADCASPIAPFGRHVMDVEEAATSMIAATEPPAAQPSKEDAMSGWTQDIAGAQDGDRYWLLYQDLHSPAELVELGGDVAPKDSWAVIWNNGNRCSASIFAFYWHKWHTSHGETPPPFQVTPAVRCAADPQPPKLPRIIEEVPWESDRYGWNAAQRGHDDRVKEAIRRAKYTQREVPLCRTCGQPMVITSAKKKTDHRPTLIVFRCEVCDDRSPLPL